MIALPRARKHMMHQGRRIRHLPSSRMAQSSPKARHRQHQHIAKQPGLLHPRQATRIHRLPAHLAQAFINGLREDARAGGIHDIHITGLYARDGGILFLGQGMQLRNHPLHNHLEDEMPGLHHHGPRRELHVVREPRDQIPAQTIPLDPQHQVRFIGEICGNPRGDRLQARGVHVRVDAALGQQEEVLHQVGAQHAVLEICEGFDDVGVMRVVLAHVVIPVGGGDAFVSVGRVGGQPLLHVGLGTDVRVVGGGLPELAGEAAVEGGG